MVKALSFKGDPKVKKRKRTIKEENTDDPGTVLPESAPQDEDDTSWVTAETVDDIAGPVLLVLPSVPTTCLACDTNGSVFASVIENMVENEPATSEPHDVRQVWIANKVAGTEGIVFKGHHGRSVVDLRKHRVRSG